MSIKKLALLSAIVVATCLGAATGHAASARTWVSNTGNDSNPCSVTQPCLTFAGAIANTASGGEINCLGPGGFGAVTISVPVTIDCEGVSNGGISVSGGNAITITGNIVVNLIGLEINGENVSAGNGVYIPVAATVSIRNCKIYGFVYSAGIYFSPSSSGGVLVADDVFLTYNNIGIYQLSPSGASNMTVHNSTITNGVYGIVVQMTTGTHAGATIEQTTLAFNNTGLLADGSGAVALIGGSTVVNNYTGVAAQAGGTVYSFKNNQIGGNSIDGTPLTAYPGFSGGGA